MPRRQSDARVSPTRIPTVLAGPLRRGPGSARGTPECRRLLKQSAHRAARDSRGAHSMPWSPCSSPSTILPARGSCVLIPMLNRRIRSNDRRSLRRRCDQIDRSVRGRSPHQTWLSCWSAPPGCPDVSLTRPAAGPADADCHRSARPPPDSSPRPRWWCSAFSKRRRADPSGTRLQRCRTCPPVRLCERDDGRRCGWSVAAGPNDQRTARTENPLKRSEQCWTRKELPAAKAQPAAYQPFLRDSPRRPSRACTEIPQSSRRSGKPTRVDPDLSIAIAHG